MSEVDSTASPGAERRVQARYDVELVAELHTAEREAINATTRNFSRGGVALVCDRRLAKDAALVVTLFLVVDGVEDEATGPLSLRTRVAWCMEGARGAWGVGLRFDGVTPAQQQRIDEFVRMLATR